MQPVAPLGSVGPVSEAPATVTTQPDGLFGRLVGFTHCGGCRCRGEARKDWTLHPGTPPQSRTPRRLRPRATRARVSPPPSSAGRRWRLRLAARLCWQRAPHWRRLHTPSTARCAALRRVMILHVSSGTRHRWVVPRAGKQDRPMSIASRLFLSSHRRHSPALPPAPSYPLPFPLQTLWSPYAVSATHLGTRVALLLLPTSFSPSLRHEW